jgi:long-subunit acyl-CoA synthetase (AMP-forming)
LDVLTVCRYINDVEGTKASLTADGYFKTGDIAEKVGEHYFIKGRSSVDGKTRAHHYPA